LLDLDVDFLARLGAVLCCLLMAACHQSADSGVPANSYRVDTISFKPDGPPQTIHDASVTPEFFEAANTRPLLGRTFLANEYLNNGQPVVILSYPFWKLRLAADPLWLGRPLTLNGQPYTIVGVMPQTFAVPPEADVWTPVAKLN
jgi:hypothetical protein